MGKKLLSVFFLVSIFFLNSYNGFGQSCPTSVSISPDTGNTICAGTPVTFTANSSGGSGTFTYQWKIDESNAGNNSNQFSTSSLENGDKVTVTVTSAGTTSCSISSSSYTMTVNANQTPTVSVSTSKSSICPGESVTFTASNTNGGTGALYSFFLNNGTTALQSGSSKTFTTTTLNNGDIIRVVLTSSLECVTSTTAETSSNSIIVRPGTPEVPGTIETSVGTEICPGTSQTYSINAVTGASSYQWILPSGWSGSSTSTSINVTTGTSGGTISVKAINDCGTSAAQDLAITVKAGTPAVPGSITGTTSVCPGVSETYSVTAISGATEYIWSLPNGWTGTSTTNSITVNTGSSGTGNISVQAKNDCGISAAKTLAVTVKPGTPATPGIISGTKAVCPGMSQTYSINAVTGASSYIWTLPNGWTGTSTTNSISVTSGTTGGNIIVKATNDCGTSTEQTLDVTVKPGTPATPGAVSGSNLVCPGTSETYSITPLEGATEYIWTLPNGWTGISSSETITVNTAQSGSGNITVKAKNDCGTSTAASIAVSVDKPAPVMSGSVTGPLKVCSTATGLVYSIPAITNATEYLWTLPTGWNITAGTGTRSITVTATSNSGDVSVIAKNTCGESSPSQLLAVNSTTGVPATPGTISAPNLPTNAICPPATGIEFNVPAVTGATSYLWTLPSGWEITSGSGTNSIVVRVNATAATTNNASVSVQAINICGNGPKSTLTGIAIDSHVFTNAGADKTVCKSLTSIPIVGEYSFSGTNANLKPVWSVPAGMGSFGSTTKLETTFTPSQAALDTGSVILTLTTDAPSGACGPGKDEVTIFFKPLPTATISAISPVCNGNTSTLTFTGTPNSRVTFKLSTGTNQTIDIGSSGTATVTTAALTANSTYSLVSAINLDTPACSNTLTGSTTITVTQKPTATISYAGPFCSSLVGAQSVSLNGTHAYTGGVFSSTTGLSISSSSGAIIPEESTPGTYTVTYNTPEAGDCAEVTATTEVIITKAPTATISYSGTPFCTSDSEVKTVTLTGTDGFSGGTFSAPEGLTLNSSTGAITASSSTAGTYIVTYNTPAAGGCTPVTATTEVTITKEPTVTISYPEGPFCLSDTSLKPVTITGTDAYTGGNYSAPSGLSIDPSTGEINPSASGVGTHTVTYTSPAASGCGEVTATTDVTITQTPEAEMSYAGPYCTSDATAHLPQFTNTSGIFEGGVFRSTPEGLSLNTATGAINAQNSSPNTYTVFYELPEGAGCETAEIQTSVKITQVPQLEISYTSPLCTSDTTSYSVIFSSNALGTYQNGTFTATSGLAIDSEGNIDASNSTSGIHTVTYTTADASGCGPVVVTTQVEIFEKPVITTPPVNVGICSTQLASFEVVASGDNLTYQWKRLDGVAITNATGVNTAKLSFSNATATNAGEYFVEITGSSKCGTISSDTVTLNIDENIVIIKPTEDLTFCDQEREDVVFEFIAHAKGAPLTFTWIKDGAEIPGTNTQRFIFAVSDPKGENGEYTGTFKIVNPNPSDNGVYAVRINGPDYFVCSEATSKTFTLSVTPLPEPPTTEPVVLCQGETADQLTASGVTGATLKWYNSQFGDDLISGTPTPGTGEANIGTTSYWVSQTTDVCESSRTELIVTVNPTPALPTTQQVVNYCFEDEDISALNATGTDSEASINWYGPNDSTIEQETAPIPVTSSTGITKYWVSQSIGACESELVEIIVNVDPLPELAVTAESQLICEGSSTILHATGADNYSWTYNGTEIGTTADLTVTPSETSIYVLTGLNNTGCENTTEITIEVDKPTVPGTLTGPESVCVTSPNGTIALSGFTGEIQRWEKSTDGSSWTSITETTPSLTFSNLTVSTSYRAVVKNGVCGELPSNEIEVKIDPLPVGGKLAFESIITTDNDGRIFIICEVNDPGYAEDLTLQASEGQVFAWRYRGTSDTSWSEIKDGDGNNFTGTVLNATQIESIVNANLNSEGKIETTVFRVELRSGACTSNVFSETAIISVIPSTIEPTPVTVNPEIVCIGESINLYAETGYENGTDIASGGMFDNANITSHGWRLRRDGIIKDENFSSAANTTNPMFWSRTGPKSFSTADINNPANISNRPYSTDGSTSKPNTFVIVSGNNPSTLELPVFSLDGTDQAILTFDQAYNLTQGASIRVEISLDGGNNYLSEPLYEETGPSSSGNFGNFASGPAGINKMQVDLGEFFGEPNLRIRFHFLGGRSGDVWAFDNIDVPDGPKNVTLEWNDYTDSENPVFIGNSGSETWTPTQIGLNTFIVKTLLTTNSNGEQCDVIQHEETVEVFVYDTYNSSPAAGPIACGTNSFELSTAVTGGNQGLITEYPTADGYIGYWEVVESPDGYVYDVSQWSGGITNPSAIFTPNIVGSYSLRWALELEDETAISECENEINEIELNIYDQYTSTATAAVEACGDNSIELTGILQGVLQGTISTLPTPDGTYGEWQVINGPEGYEYDENQFSSSNTSISPINDPAAIFTPTLVGTYTLRWAIINENNTDCEHSVTDVNVTVYDLYTSTAEAVLDTCATNSFNLTATVSGAIQGVISLPALDGTTGKWEVIEFPEGYEFSESHFTGGSTNPNTVFTPVILGEYTLNWTLVNENQAAECIIPATVSVKLFDQYTLTAEAKIGSCGDFIVQLTGTTSGIWQENLTYPTQDGYIGQWRVEGGDGTFSNPDINDDLEPINNPNAIYTATDLSNYTFYWELVPDPNYEGDFIENTSCPATPAEISIEVKECIALDFDGVNDYADLGNGYTGNYSYEAWIRPYDREIPEGGTTNSLVGTIISGPGYEINMEDLPNTIVKNSRWYHIAVTSSGKLFVDGIPISSYSLTTGGQAATIIGASINPETGISENHFSGWIEEVRIWTGEIEQDQIRFLMNQRLQNAANIGVEIPMVAPGLPYTSLAGYYQLLAVPELIAGGITPNLAQNQQNNPGLLLNMETLQENTAPLPYTSRIDGQTWATDDTWTNYTVWDAPNSAGVDGTPIDWNIVKTDHNIHSGDKDITVLGLKSMTAEKLLTVVAPGTENEYNEGRKLRVTHYLLLNGNIDLIGQSQLLQDSGSILDESSGGWLERDQQGKENSLVYNYWSSPVSPQGQANNATYTIKSVLNNPNGTITYVNDPFAADATPVNANNVIISSYWLNAYYANTADQYALWQRILETGTLKTGEGFTMKGTSGSAALEEERNYTFKGKPHNGDFGLSIAADQNYLIGNPYPSALDGWKFIENNIDRNVFDGSLYFWDHFKEVSHILKEYVGGYAVLNLTSEIGVPAISIDERINPTEEISQKKPTRFIPVSQGFMINSTGVNGGEVQFKNSQREFVRDGDQSTSLFLKPEVITKSSKNESDDYSRIRLSFSSPIGYYRQILVGAIPHTTNGFDFGYDAFLFDDNVEDMYWIQDNNNLVIQGVPNFNNDQVLPLGIKVKENKEFLIKIDELENTPESFNIYLKDNLNDTIHNLRAAPYTSTSEPGIIQDRFEIVFFNDEIIVEKPLPEIPEEEIPGDKWDDFTELTVRHSHTKREIQILNPNQFPLSNMYIFDINGNQIEHYRNLSHEKEVVVPVRNFSSGVYIVQLYSEGRIISKKIIINN